MDSDFQKRITTIFDYTYSNTSVRLPAQVGIEVGKILHTGLYREERQGLQVAYDFAVSEIRSIQAGVKSNCIQVATDVRGSFERMNKDLGLYEEGIRFEDSQLSYIVSLLNGIQFSNKERDYFGDALEIFRSTWAKQAGGQFFTDQLVTSLALKMIEFDPRKGDDLVDLCAGTGGFLLAGFHRIRELVSTEQGTEKEIIKLASKSLMGVEIDQEISDVGNSTLTSRLGSIDKKHIFCANSLDIESLSKNSRIKMGTHMCAATNPPFGAKIQIRDFAILNSFELAKLKGSTIDATLRTNDTSSRSPDILFIEQNVKLLKPGVGRLAIVVPYQILSGAQATYIRYWLLLNCSISAVVDLPSETFQPHTGTKTALVILKKRKRPLVDLSECSDEKVFMATPRWIGHDRRGNPVYARDQEGKVTNEILTDFHNVEVEYERYLRGLSLGEYSETHIVEMVEILRDKHIRINATFYKQQNEASSLSLVQGNTDEWRVVKLKNLVKKIFYPGRFKRSYVDKYPDAVPFLGGSNITELITETHKWIRPDDRHIDQLRVKADWILVTRSGSTGIVSTVPAAWDGFAMSEHVIRIIPDPEKLPGEYIYAFLKSKLGQVELSKGVFGSVIEEISPEGIGDINILIPKDIEIFKHIVDTVHKSQSYRNNSMLENDKAIQCLEDLLAK
jgi:type I restriction enzyme M protein